jgi:pimeloyl-ACP methyl ester carboxylesterase
MPYAQSGAVRLYYEEVGSGLPIVWVHEMGSDLRQWEQQLRYFGRAFRCVAFNARGYAPSDVPKENDNYLYDRFAADIGAVMDHCGIDRAYVVGWSMGAYAALIFALRHPERIRGVVATGVGSGSPRAEHAHFQSMMAQVANLYRTQGAAHVADIIANGATRLQLKRKDPRGWAAFRDDLAGHDAEGMAMTSANYQGRRPSLEDFEAEFRALTAPVLLAVGDEDTTCVETNLWLKGILPSAGIWMAPQTGHAPNLEDPAAYNRVVQDFIDAVERGGWATAVPAQASARMT